MAEESISVTRDELDELGAKLDAADLSDKDRQVLLAVFAIVGDTIAKQEVSGFGIHVFNAAFSPIATGGGKPLSRGLAAAFENSFVSGPRTGVPNPGTQAIIYIAVHE